MDKLIQYLRTFFFGEIKKGEKIFEKEIKFHTFVPETKTDFNQWASTLNVSAKAIK